VISATPYLGEANPAEIGEIADQKGMWASVFDLSTFAAV